MAPSQARSEAPMATHTRPLPPEYRLGPDGTVTLRICFNSSCARSEIITFTDSDLRQVRQQIGLCPNADLDARLQRVRIGIWQMQKLAQKYVPVLANDREVNDREYGVEGRTDCIDNATNTTTYLQILAALGELSGWSVDAPSVRSLFDINAVHWTAVISDQSTGERWAVDSWFRPNGNLPFVLPLSNWTLAEKGWVAPFDLLNRNPRYSSELCGRLAVTPQPPAIGIATKGLSSAGRTAEFQNTAHGNSSPN
jgi:hypothetical protein